MTEVNALESWNSEENHIAGKGVGTKLRNFVFTIQSCDVDLDKKFYLEDDVIQYLVAGFETCPTTGRKHVQGYCELNKQLMFSKVKKMLPTAYIAIAKGNAKQNMRYCKKDGWFIEHGSPKQPGMRTDLDNVLETLKAGGSIKQVILANPNLQAVVYAEKVAKYLEPGRDWMPETYWIYGRAGLGKNRLGMEILTDWCKTNRPDIVNIPLDGITNKNDDTKWLHKYDRHPCVLISDIRGDFKVLNFMTLLSMLDRYEHFVEIKGSTRQFVPKVIVITSTQSPVEYCAQTRSEDPAQLYRRLSHIIHMKYDDVDDPLGSSVDPLSRSAQRSRVILDLDPLSPPHPDLLRKKVVDFCSERSLHASVSVPDIDEELELMY